MFSCCGTRCFCAKKINWYFHVVKKKTVWCALYCCHGFLLGWCFFTPLCLFSKPVQRFPVWSPCCHLIQELRFVQYCGDTFGGSSSRCHIPAPVGENGACSDAGVVSGDGSEFPMRGLVSERFGKGTGIVCFQ